MDVNDIGSLLEFSDRGVEWFMSLMLLAFLLLDFWGSALSDIPYLFEISIHGCLKNTHPRAPNPDEKWWTWVKDALLPSGKLLHNYGKDPPFFMGKSTISMAMFNSYVKLPEGNFFVALHRLWGSILDGCQDMSGSFCRSKKSILRPLWWNDRWAQVESQVAGRTFRLEFGMCVGGLQSVIQQHFEQHQNKDRVPLIILVRTLW